jgi:hypothetical protein
VLVKLAGCTDGQTCPAAWTAEDGTVLVRGDLTERADVPLGAGEVLVRVPASTLLEAAERLRG